MAKNNFLKNNSLEPKKFFLFALFLIIISVIISFTCQQVSDRLSLGPYPYIHDGAIETEEAIKYLLKGKNPYTENYFNTPMDNMGGLPEMDFVNPASYHFVYLPFNILFSVPFFIASNFLLHWFDERIVYIFIFLLFIALILKWPGKTLERKLIFLTLFAVNPLFFLFLVNGRNDIFVFLWIALAVYFIDQKKNNCSSLFLALAVTSKQSSWVLLPFYFAYLYYQQTKETLFWNKINNVFKETYLFFAASAIILIPFLIWDFNSFIDDIVKYPNGTAFMSYPMGGFGFSHLLLQLKIVSSPNIYWPFWIPQMIFSLPLLLILLKMQKNNNSSAQMIFSFSLLLMTFWLFSRFFNDNYMGFLIMLFLFAVFLIEPPKKKLLPIKN